MTNIDSIYRLDDISLHHYQPHFTLSHTYVYKLAQIHSPATRPIGQHWSPSS